MALVLQSMVLAEVRANGVADKVIPWDDCGFLFAGLLNAQLIRSEGLLGALPSLQLTHVPLTYLHSTAALLLSGGRVWAVHLFAGCYLFLVLWTLTRALRLYGPLAVLSFTLCLVTVPMVYLFTSTMKTDHLAGALLFVLIVELFLVEGVQPSLARSLYLLCLAALIVMCKLMAFYLPFLVALVFTAHFLRDWILRGRGVFSRGRLAFYAAGLAVPVLTYLAVVLPNLGYYRAYIAQALTNPLWLSDFSWSDRLLYYLPFATAQGFWGRGGAWFSLLCAGFLLALIRRRMTRRDLVTGGALLGLALAAYLPITLSPQFQMALGAQFAGCILAILLYMLTIALREDVMRLPFLTAITMVSLASFQLPVQRWVHWHGETYSPADVAQAAQIIEEFGARMVSTSPVAHPRIYFNLSPIPYPNFGIDLYRRAGWAPAAMIQPLVFDPAAIDQDVAASQFVVLYQPPSVPDRSTDLFQRLGAQVREYILQRYDLTEVARASLRDHSYRLYAINRRQQPGLSPH